MKEFCRKEIDFKVIKLNNSVDQMVGFMRAHHQEVEVVDMSQTSHSIVRERVEAIECVASVDALDDLYEQIKAAYKKPTESEMEDYKNTKFIKGTTKDIGKRM